MKIAIILTFVISCSTLFSQTRYDNINLIRKQVQEINNYKGLNKKVLENDEFLKQTPDGGGTLTGYFKNEKLVKIVEWVGLSSCVNITEYYLKDSKLIFVYTQGKEFNYLSNGSASVPKLTLEARFYFNNNKPVKHTLKGNTKCGGQPSPDWGKDYLHNCSKYKGLLGF